MATDKKLTGIRFPEDVLDKVKYIAMKDRRTTTTAIIIACEEYIAKYEEENGEITKKAIMLELKGMSLDVEKSPSKRVK